MKHLLQKLTLFFMAILAFSCGKDDFPIDSNDSPLLFDIAFVVVDSLGNNLLPPNLPANPVVDPNSFTAESNLSSNKGYFSVHPELGHIFRIQESLPEIWNSERWLSDSTFLFVSCFGGDCDTLEVYKPNKNAAEVELSCFAQRIVWNSDTIENYNCTIIPYVIND